MRAKQPRRDEQREERIGMEIIVEAYGAEEQAMGWYYYLENRLRFPFKATCIKKRPISPLKVEDQVEVTGMPSEEECEKEMFVTIRWGKDDLAVPLAQLKPIKNTDAQTRDAIDDWHYWVGMGYQFG
ncbi:MAG: calcium-binding protein [Nitrospira sp.]|nr:calcium-binding protein [Nitrospira sp.]